MSTLSRIDLTWCHHSGSPCKSLLLPSLLCLSRVKSFLSLGMREGAASVSIQFLHLLCFNTNSFFYVVFFFVFKSGNEGIGVRIVTFPFVCKEEASTAAKRRAQFWSSDTNDLYQSKAMGQSQCVFAKLGSSKIHTCSELRSFVCQCLCHCLAGVSPQSAVWDSECDSLGGNCFTACLSLLLSHPSNGCMLQKGDSAINRACSLMKGTEVLHIADRVRLMFAGDERACVPSVWV